MRRREHNVTFSSGRALDAAAAKECFDHLIEVHERAKGDLAIKMTQTILDAGVFFFASHLKMSMVSGAGVTGLAAHPCDYYEITAELDKNSAPSTSPCSPRLSTFWDVSVKKWIFPS